MPELYDKGLEKYKTSSIFISNLMMIIWIALGTIAVWLFNTLLAGVFLFFAIITIYVFLRKLVCTNCYYYDRWCAFGWGKLSAKMFKRGNIENFNESIGIRIAPIVYGLLAIIPFIAIIAAIVLAFDYTKIIVLIFLVAISVYSVGVGRKAACSSCKMRSSCKGSAV